MKKKVVSFCLLFSVFFTASFLMASPKIMKMPEHKGKNCVFCHDKANYPKKKAGYNKGGANYKKLASDKSCSGAGCHK